MNPSHLYPSYYNVVLNEFNKQTKMLQYGYSVDSFSRGYLNESIKQNYDPFSPLARHDVTYNSITLSHRPNHPQLGINFT